jgi:hypothetical protein
MKERPVNWVSNFEEAFATVAMYLIIATSKQKPDTTFEGFDKVHNEHFEGKDLSQLVADALNRVDQLKLTPVNFLNNN